MTAPNWVGQLVLNQVFKRGVDLVIQDPMAAPLLTGSKSVRTIWDKPVYHFRTCAGGVFVVPSNVSYQNTAIRASERRLPRLSVAQTFSEARQQALINWGSSVDYLFDGDTLQAVDAVGVPNASVFEARMSDALGSDPVTLAKQISFGHIQVLVTGEPIVWIEAINCARTVSRNCARRIAMARCLDLASNPDVTLAIPTGRVRLQFGGRVGTLRFETSCAASITSIDANTVEIATPQAAIGVVDVGVDSAFAVLERIGLVLPLGRADARLDSSDPLEKFADLLNMDDV